MNRHTHTHPLNNSLAHHWVLTFEREEEESIVPSRRKILRWGHFPISLFLFGPPSPVYLSLAVAVSVKNHSLSEREDLPQVTFPGLTDSSIVPLSLRFVNNLSLSLSGVDGSKRGPICSCALSMGKGSLPRSASSVFFFVS